MPAVSTEGAYMLCAINCHVSEAMLNRKLIFVCTAEQGKRMKDVVNRMHVAIPQPRDHMSRPAVIPPGIAQARAARDSGYKPPTEKDLQASCTAELCNYAHPFGMATILACTM